MASIIKVPRKNKRGFAYRVQVRRSGASLTEIFDTKRDAEEWAREHDREAHLAKINAGHLGRTRPVSQLFDAYMRQYSGKDPSIFAKLEWWEKQIGHMKVVEVTRGIVIDARKKLREEPARIGHGKGSRSTGKKRSPATVNRYLATLSAVFRWAIEEDWVQENPCRGIGRGKETSHFGRKLEHNEREALLEACRKSEWPGLYPLVILALSTGGRLSELLNLKWSDIDFKRGTATLRHTKNGQLRLLPLIKPVQDELHQWGRVRRLDSDLIFPSEKDPDKPFTFRKHWNKARSVAGIEDFLFHWLRHTCASYLTANGVPLVTVAQILGHQTMAMVQRYSHEDVKHHKAVLDDTFGDLLG